MWFRLFPMVAQFMASASVYLLLLLLTLGEEFKHCPTPLQSLCCWIHETKYARTLVTLTAITINFSVAFLDIVSLKAAMIFWKAKVSAELFPLMLTSSL